MKNLKKKILIVGYGGTIMMVIDPTRKAVVPAKNIQEIFKLIPSVSEIANVEFEILENKDSTDVGPSDWTRLAIEA